MKRLVIAMSLLMFLAAGPTWAKKQAPAPTATSTVTAKSGQSIDKKTKKVKKNKYKKDVNKKYQY